MIYWVAYYIIKIFFKIFFPIRTTGFENIPPSGSYILASNHLSYLDPLIIGLSIPRRLSYLAKDSLFKNRIFGALLKQCGAFPVKRETSDIRSIREALKRIQKGEPLVFFPQGTRKASLENVKVYSGIGFLVAKTRVPVIPIKITGSDQALPPGRRFLKRHLVFIHFGKPLEFAKEDVYQQVASRIMSTIESL